MIALNPTCSMMLRREYPELLDGEDRERAKKLAAAVAPTRVSSCGRCAKRSDSTPISRAPPVTRSPITRPAICARRGSASRDGICFARFQGVTPATVMECCGHDGTHAMTVEGFEYSIRVGQKAFDGMKDADAEIWATDCPLAAIQFQQHAGVKPLHPMSILARAYREDGFDAPKALPSGATPEGEPK